MHLGTVVTGRLHKLDLDAFHMAPLCKFSSLACRHIDNAKSSALKAAFELFELRDASSVRRTPDTNVGFHSVRFCHAFCEETDDRIAEV